MKKKVSDFQTKEGGKNSYDILKYTKDQKCIPTTSDIRNVENIDQEQRVTNIPDRLLQSGGECSISNEIKAKFKQILDG